MVTLGGTLAAVKLAAADSSADVATLAAVGASPAVRRRLAASQAGVISGLGTGLGILSGVLAGWILIRLQHRNENGEFWFGGDSSDGWDMVVPWGHLIALGVGVPVLAAVVSFATTRSRLPLVRRLGQ